MATRAWRHAPRAAALAHMRRGADVLPPPQLSGLVCRDTSSPLAEGFWASQSQEEEHFGGRLSLEVLESWGKKVRARREVGSEEF